MLTLAKTVFKFIAAYLWDRQEIKSFFRKNRRFMIVLFTHLVLSIYCAYAVEQMLKRTKEARALRVELSAQVVRNNSLSNQIDSLHIEMQRLNTTLANSSVNECRPQNNNPDQMPDWIIYHTQSRGEK